MEIIQYLPEDEYNKIPEDKIEFFKKNMDTNYEFTIDPGIDLSKQNISRKANAIIISIFLDYFATEKQKEKIIEILKYNEQQVEQEKRNKYNPNTIFKNLEKESIQKIPAIQNTQPTVSVVEYKENFFTKFKRFILKLLQKDD